MEDYQHGSRPRMPSAVRNIHAGIFLLYKEVETCLMKSLYVTRAQNARFFQLRACMSLVRANLGANRRVGRRTTAIDWLARLAELYESLNEGLDTTDMADARSLLKDNPV